MPVLAVPRCCAPGVLAALLVGLGAAPAVGQDGDEQILRLGGHVFGGGRDFRVDTGADDNGFLAGTNVAVSGSFGDDIFLAGGEVEFDGTVAGDLFFAGGTLEMIGGVGDDVFAAGGTLRLHPESTVAGDVFLAGGMLTVDGAVEGNLHAYGQRVVLQGDIAGDVTVEAEELEIGPGARVGGQLSHRVMRDVEIAADALIGAIDARERSGREDGPISSIVSGVLRALALTLMAAALHLVAPGFISAAADGLGARPLPSFGWGIGLVVAAQIAVVLLAITLIGIPAAVFVGVVMMLASVVGAVVAAYWLGLYLRRFATASLRDPEFWGRVLWTLVGFAAVVAAAWVPIVGPLAVALLFLAALGATLVALWARFRGPAPVSPAV